MGCFEKAFEFSPIFQSASVTENQSQQSGGYSFDQSVKFTQVRVSPVNDDVYNDLMRRPWVLLILDQNKQYKMVGSKDYPLRLIMEAKTGAEISDLNHVSMSFSGQSPFRAVFVDKPL